MSDEIDMIKFLRLAGDVAEAQEDGRITAFEWIKILEAIRDLIGPLGKADKIIDAAIATVKEGLSKLQDGFQLSDVKAIIQKALDEMPDSWD